MTRSAHTYSVPERLQHIATVAMPPVKIQLSRNVGDGFGMNGESTSQAGNSVDFIRRLFTALTCTGLALSVLAGCSDSGVVLASSAISNDEPTKDPVQDGEKNPTPPLSLVELGERIFNDTNLSSPAGQSCGSCHGEESGFVDPAFIHPSSLGADGGHFGNRNTPTLFYASHIPEFQLVERPDFLTQIPTETEFGGFFIDGRAATLKEQAKQPFFNPIEMALSSTQEFATRIQQSDYSNQFQTHFGSTVFEDPDETLDAAAGALAEFQRSSRFSPFNSKFDRVKQGQETFTDSETRGEALFNGRALCSVCHTSPDEPEVFSDFLYHNIGTPRNTTLLNNFGDEAFVDMGLGAITGDADNNGQFRTPTLRNVALTAPYMHNGMFSTLREVVEFYNSESVPPEVPGSNIPPFIGLLFLTEVEVDDIVAFLNTLTDR